ACRDCTVADLAAALPWRMGNLAVRQDAVVLSWLAPSGLSLRPEGAGSALPNQGCHSAEKCLCGALLLVPASGACVGDLSRKDTGIRRTDRFPAAACFLHGLLRNSCRYKGCQRGCKIGSGDVAGTLWRWCSTCHGRRVDSGSLADQFLGISFLQLSLCAADPVLSYIHCAG